MIQLSFNLIWLQVGPARFRAPEVLFRPDLLGEECEAMHEVLLFSIQKSDMDLRKILFQNIVLSGGTTLFKGFGDRLLGGVRKLAPKDVKIKISAPRERLYSTWIGGSILASLDTFKKMWISKKEYDEEGIRVVHRKTFWKINCTCLHLFKVVIVWHCKFWSCVQLINCLWNHKRPCVIIIRHAN